MQMTDRHKILYLFLQSQCFKSILLLLCCSPAFLRKCSRASLRLGFNAEYVEGCLSSLALVHQSLCSLSAGCILYVPSHLLLSVGVLPCFFFSSNFWRSSNTWNLEIVLRSSLLPLWCYTCRKCLKISICVHRPEGDRHSHSLISMYLMT